MIQFNFFINSQYKVMLMFANRSARQKQTATTSTVKFYFRIICVKHKFDL